MFRILFKKIGTSLLCFLMIGVFALSPLTPLIASTDTTSYLNELTASLVKIGEVVANSASIPDTDKVTLMTQLIAISTRILELRKTTQLSVSSIPATTPISTAKSAKVAKLKQVIVSYDALTNNAVAKIIYEGREQTISYNLPEVKIASLFDEKIAILKKAVTDKIAGTTNIVAKDIFDLTFVTARNPLRDSLISLNSPAAQNLAKNFLQNSIVSRVNVMPGKYKGSIEIFTDQDESLLLTLKAEFDNDGNPTATYTYSYEFFFSSPHDTTESLINGTIYVKEPKVRTTSTNIKETDIKKTLMSVFNDVPFTSTINNFSSKLLSFLVNNPTYYQAQELRLRADSSLDCYAKTDKLVVNEFIRYLVGGLTLQVNDTEKLTKFMAPILVQTDEYSPEKCMSKIRMF
jgi:hypothetical protein